MLVVLVMLKASLVVRSILVVLVTLTALLMVLSRDVGFCGFGFKSVDGLVDVGGDFGINMPEVLVLLLVLVLFLLVMVLLLLVLVSRR